jgi:hypothetical protein
MGSVVAEGDMRALIDAAEVRALALEFGMAREAVAREMVAARDGFTRFTRRGVTSVLDRGEFTMACSVADVVSETHRRLSAREYAVQYPEPESVTWLDQQTSRKPSKSFTLDSRLDVILAPAASAEKQG